MEEKKVVSHLKNKCSKVKYVDMDALNKLRWLTKGQCGKEVCYKMFVP